MRIVFLLVLFAAALAHAQTRPVWQDEFEGKSIDPAKWSFDIGNGFWAGETYVAGWGNQEDEYYTDRPQNAFVADGVLHIRAIQEDFHSDDKKFRFTSARIKTDKLFSQAYGRFEFRAKSTQGAGLWPAVWMLPANSPYGGWPSSGEIDILENKGVDPRHVQGSLHTGASFRSHNTQTLTFDQSGKEPPEFRMTDWHVYTLNWTRGTADSPGKIEWGVDGIVYETCNGGWTVPSSASNKDAPFDQPFYLLINLAVGGQYQKPHVHPTTIPSDAELQVDYVRVYEH